MKPQCCVFVFLISQTLNTRLTGTRALHPRVYTCLYLNCRHFQNLLHNGTCSKTRVKYTEICNSNRRLHGVRPIRILPHGFRRRFRLICAHKGHMLFYRGQVRVFARVDAFKKPNTPARNSQVHRRSDEKSRKRHNADYFSLLLYYFPSVLSSNESHGRYRYFRCDLGALRCSRRLYKLSYNTSAKHSRKNVVLTPTAADCRVQYRERAPCSFYTATNYYLNNPSPKGSGICVNVISFTNRLSIIDQWALSVTLGTAHVNRCLTPESIVFFFFFENTPSTNRFFLLPVRAPRNV